jgi:hypothetical protein
LRASYSIGPAHGHALAYQVAHELGDAFLLHDALRLHHHRAGSAGAIEAELAPYHGGEVVGLLDVEVRVREELHEALAILASGHYEVRGPALQGAARRRSSW